MHVYDTHWFTVASVRAKNKVLWLLWKTARGVLGRLWSLVQRNITDYKEAGNYHFAPVPLHCLE